MGKGLGSHRRAATVKIGALVAVLVLTLLVPTLAFAANTATFSGFTPAKGSFVANVSPKVSVVVYDRYGVSGSSNYRIYVDGVRRTTSIARYSGYGLKKFKLSAVPSGLSNGAHTVTAWVKDAKGLISKYSWVVNVDTVAPVTTLSKALPVYPGSDIVKLNATDAGSGVAQTFFILDGVQTASDFVFSDFVIGTHTLTFWSVDKAGNVAARQTMTWKIADGHDMPQFAADASCIAVGCHGTTSVKVIHNAVGCVCHESAANATNDCVVCHSGDNAPANHAVHKPIVSAAAAGSAKDCLTCHTSGLMGIHSTCAACHNPADKTSGPGALAAAAIAGGTATCESCHDTYDATHTGANVSHQVAGSCFTATCHGGDVTKMHTIDFRGDGSNIPGCVACHAPGRTPSTNCQDCHIGFVAKHDYKKAHADLAAALDAASTLPGKLCTKCHGNDVTNILDGEGKTLVLTSGSHAGKAQHEGCSCHAYGEARLENPAAGCASCHENFNNADGTGKYAYHVGYHNETLVESINAKAAACAACHGNDVNHVGSRLVAGGEVSVPASMTAPVQEHTNCSCHTYNEVEVGGGQTCADCHKGAYGPIHGWSTELGPRSAGLWTVSGHNTTMMGTVGARTTFTDLGIKDTADATPTVEMPLTVNNTFKTGYGWDSVITCEDCHTGLVDKEVAGPHGGSTVENWGIDPAYSGSFETASLWGGSYTAAGKTWGPYAEGIAQWAPAGATEEEKQELVNYQVVTPDMSTATTTALVPGPATITAGNVICVKCHDLYDETKTTGYKGWGNYAHEHHSADTGSFKMYFGKYTVTVDGTNAGDYTVAAESMAAAKTQVVADHGGSVVASSQVVAASLGRETAGACRNCHIAIPHGWKRPKLIVYSNLPDPAGTTFRADKGLPAQGDSAPYNIGPSVYEGEGLAGTNIGSGQMNGLASSPVVFKEATHLLSGQVATIGSDPAQLLIETFNYPSLYEAAAGTGDEFVNWSSAQCNACGHHSSTSFVNPTAVQPPMAWNSRESNWTSTKPANGAWK